MANEAFGVTSAHNTHAPDDLGSLLDSALCESLVHAVGITAPLLDADLVAARIYEAPTAPAHAYVDHRRLRPEPDDLTALHAWPQSDDSLFALARRLHDAGQVIPNWPLAGPNAVGPELFGPIAHAAPLVDCYCLRVIVSDPVWALIAFVRCQPSERFADDQVSAIERIKPAIGGLLRRGCRRQNVANGHAGMRAAGSQRAVFPDDLLSRLSQTESQILDQLLSDRTERVIAESIERSPHTVHVHVKSIYRKLGVNSRRSLRELFEHSARGDGG